MFDREGGDEKFSSFFGPQNFRAEIVYKTFRLEVKNLRYATKPLENDITSAWLAETDEANSTLPSAKIPHLQQ